MITNTLSTGELINTTISTNIDRWGLPKQIDFIECSDSIEIIYKEAYNGTYNSYPYQDLEERVFKIVFSCEDGKWNKSDRIYGEIIPSADEYYEF
jgi:hypothetical protein